MNRVHRWYCSSWHWARTLQRSIVPWVLEGVDLGPEILELGAGPGLATDVLRQRADRVTAIEIDVDLAQRLRDRLAGTNVSVTHGDASRMSFESETFTGVVSFAMLHHLPSAARQDLLLREVGRVLAPGGVFAGSDVLPTFGARAAHLFDTMVPVHTETFRTRLEAAGFVEIDITCRRRHFRFVARRSARSSEQAA